MTSLTRGTTVQLWRWWRQTLRQPASLAFALGQPLLWLLLFGSLFQGNVRLGPLPGSAGRPPDYLSFLTAGVVVLTVFTNAMMAGIPLLFDRENGLLERVLASPVPRSAMLAGRFAFVVLLSSAQALAILGLAAVMGVGIVSGWTGLVGVLVAVGLLGAGLTMVSMALAFVLENHADFFALVGFLSLPLVFLSSALVPLHRMPGWMATLAMANPMTYAIEAVRALMLDGWSWEALALPAAGLAGFVVLSFAFATTLFRRRLG